MRGLVVLLSLCLLLVLAHHGEGRVLPNDMFSLQREESMEAVGVSISKGNRHGATPKPVPCTWICGEGENHNYECNCIPNASKKDELVEAEKTTVAHAKARKPLPCTWVCGVGENHNYECNCIPNAPKEDQFMGAPVNAPVGGHH